MKKKFVSESFDLNKEMHDNIFERVESIKNFYSESYCHKENYERHDLLVESYVDYFYGGSNCEWVNMDDFSDWV